MMGKRPRRKAGSYITQAEGDSLDGLSGNAQAVYFALRLCMNSKTGKTQPIGYGLLMKRVPVSKPTLNRAVRELVGAGLLTRETVGSREKQRNVYGFPKALDSHGSRVSPVTP